MRFENEARLQKIKRISGLLRVVCGGMAAVVVVVFVGAVVGILVGRGVTIQYYDTSFKVAELGGGGRAVLVGACGLGAGVLLKCLFHFRNLLGDFSRGEVFTRGSVGQIRKLGIGCVLWGVTSIVWGVLPWVILARRPSLFQINPEAIVIGAIVIVVSWFMEMAVELREENELTI